MALWLDEAPPDCISHQAGGLMEVELLHDPSAVGFSRLYANVQHHCDLFGGLTFRNQLQNLPLLALKGSAGISVFSW